LELKNIIVAVDFTKLKFLFCHTQILSSLFIILTSRTHGAVLSILHFLSTGRHGTGGSYCKRKSALKDADIPLKIEKSFTMVPFPVSAVKIWPVMLGELSLLQAYISAAVLHSSSYSVSENIAIHYVDEAKVRIFCYVWSCRYRIG
jgi:hypothetical protein